MKFIALLLLFFNLVACKKARQTVKLVTPGTATIGIGSCVFLENIHTSICFDSLITDSRCPVNANCIWQGVASVQMKYTNSNQAIYFRLRTKLGTNNANAPANVDASFGRNDTTINGLKISLEELTPYPSFPPGNQPYTVMIAVE